MENKPLVVVIDEEGRSNLRDLNFRWFYDGKKQNDQSYHIQTPMGEDIEVHGTLVRDPRLHNSAEEYVYLELTNACNFCCPHCGIKDTLSYSRKAIDGEVAYLTEEFSTAFTEAIKENGRLLGRKVFFGGGEPLIAPNKFRFIKDLFDKLDRTETYVATNGSMLPLDFGEFQKFMESINNPYLVLSGSDAHINQYARLATNGEYGKIIPNWCHPKQAFTEKAKLIQEYCRNLDVNFIVNLVEERPGELRRSILESAHGLNVFSTQIDGKRIPCSQGQEISIRADGRVYPHCYDIFNGHNKLGILGLLTEQKEE